MDLRARGIGRYLNEYLFHQAVEYHPRRFPDGTQRQSHQLTASQGRAARALLDEKLAARGRSMDALGVDGQVELMLAIDETLAEVWADYRPTFGDAENFRGQPANKIGQRNYQALHQRFGNFIGARSTPDGGVRLPVSPFDPRWSMRSSVQANGVTMMSISDDLVTSEVFDESGYDRLARVAANETFTLQTLDVPDGWRTPRGIGPAMTAEDMVGVSAFRGRMSEADYAEIAPWVSAGAREIDENTGVMKGPIDAGVIERATAILDYLDEQGLTYSVGKDRELGQVAVRLDGSKTSIRLIELGSRSPRVGEVYDNDVVTFFSLKNGEKGDLYTPTADEAVAMVQVALGREVERFDGQGTIGVPPVRGDAPRQPQENYYPSGGGSVMLAAREGLWMRRTVRSRSERVAAFLGETRLDDASSFLATAVESAQRNVVGAIDVDGLIELARENAFNMDYVPDFSGIDDELVVLKQEYWRLLTDPGSGVLLLDPGSTRADYEAQLVEGVTSPSVASAMAEADPEAQIRAHAELVAGSMVGSYTRPVEGEAQPEQFNIGMVAKYMDSAENTWRNDADLAEACRVIGVDPAALTGDATSVRMATDRMVTFNEQSAVDMAQHPNAHMRELGERARAAIERSAADVTSMKVDEQGIIEWTAQRRVGMNDSRQINAAGNEAGARDRYVTGRIGQIFVPGAHGEIVTDFAGGNNFSFMPGYNARVIPQKPGENLSLEERTRVTGYMEQLTREVESQVARDIMSTRSEVGTPTSMNSTVRRTAPSSDRHPADYFAVLDDESVPQIDRDFVAAQAEMGLRLVRYPSAMGVGSGVLAQRRALNDVTYDPRNDNSRDWLVMTGGRNVNQLDREAGAGFFDPMATGTDGNLGVHRYLAAGAEVAADGTIVRSELDQDTPIGVMAHPYMATVGYNPADRQIKGTADAKRALGVDAQVGTALLSLAGWNYEDGVVVSEEFASRNKVVGADGVSRSLMVGDKVSTGGNNKGVISAVVDRYMDPEQAKALGVDSMVDLFSDNNGLDVVMSPYSPISRFNGGTAREMMTGASDLVLRDEDGQATTVAGGLGPLNIVIMPQLVDLKTNVYTADEYAKGKGRKAGNQWAWAMESAGAHATMVSIFGENTRGQATMQEYLLSLGFDMNAAGELAPEISPESLSSRKVFTLPTQLTMYNSKNSGVNHRAMRAQFGVQISQSGGLMELPFPLTMHNGEQTPESPTTPGRYVVPVLSSHLRTEQDLPGGGVASHDYTNGYLKMFGDATVYLEQEALLAEATAAGDQEAIERLTAAMTKTVASAQRGLRGMGSKIESRHISSKTNMFKEMGMSVRVANSATAVWTPDPRLGVDQVSMNSDMARELGVHMMTQAQARAAGVEWTGNEPDAENAYVLLWRDPVLTDGAMRYMRVVIDESLTGVAVNPVMVKSMDGDFDGDTPGLMGGFTAEAHADLLEKFTVEANLLSQAERTTVEWGLDDEGTPYKLDEPVSVRPLSLHDGLDIEAACRLDPALAAMRDGLTYEANMAHDAGSRDGSRWVMSKLSDEFYPRAFELSRGAVTLSFADLPSHLRSVQDCYLLGGKGSESKLMDYTVYLGADPVFDDNGEVIDAVDTGKPDPAVLDQCYRDSQLAMSAKFQVTGVAGAISQRAVRLLRPQGKVKEAIELGYPATQAVLQIKHDPKLAVYLADTVMGPAKDLWTGYRLNRELDEDGRYQWSRDLVDGKPVMATTEQFTEQFMAMYSHKEGMGVNMNREYVEVVAKALSDPTGRIIDTSRGNYDSMPHDVAPLALDRMAYGGSLDELKVLAEARSPLFTGMAAEFSSRAAMSPWGVHSELAKVGANYEPAGVELVDYEPVLVPRADVGADYKRVMPRSEWVSRLPGWTSAERTRTDAFEPVRHEAPAPEVLESALVGSPAIDGAALMARIENTAAAIRGEGPVEVEYGG